MGYTTGHHTPFSCMMHDTTPRHSVTVNHSCSSLQGTHQSVVMAHAAAETPCGPVLASRAMLSEVRHWSLASMHFITLSSQMALPAADHLQHPSPSLVEVGGQATRVDLCVEDDDDDLGAGGLEGDTFDLGFDLVRVDVLCRHHRLTGALTRTFMARTPAWSSASRAPQP